MGISYRMTSGGVLAAFIFSFALGRLFPRQSSTTPAVTNLDGTVSVSFDLCMMWEQIPWTSRIAILFWFGSLVFLVVQGLRNRPVARWWPIANLIGYAGVLEHERWSLQHCFTTPGLVGFWMIVGAVVLMDVHQLLPRLKKALSGV